MKRLKVFTWHVHGNYLYYLCQSPHDFYVPVKPERSEGYGGRGGKIAWPDNLRQVPADEVRDLDLDCVLFQSRRNWLVDQYEILSESQRGLPRIYLEHDPPRENPTETRHPAADSDVLLVHVTPFNDLMWDAGATPTRVVEHGVMVPEDVRYAGDLERGIVVVNNIRSRGRRLGADIFQEVRKEVPLDLVGMGSREMGGLGEVPQHELWPFASHYRFFFNPIRYTSLGLAVCEAMMAGLPVVALATTEMPTVVQNGVSGYVDTDWRRLIDRMKELLAGPEEARRLGENARKRALERFNIQRFTRDWDAVFATAVGEAATGLIPAATREVI